MSKRFYALYDVASTVTVGVFDSLDTLRRAATTYAGDQELALNVDVVCYEVPLNALFPIGHDNDGVIEI